MRTLLPHQVPALDFVNRFDRAGLFMDKRLGKCAVAIRWAVSRACKRILVVSPLSACPGWLDELEADGQLGALLWGKCRISKLVDFEDQPSECPRFYVINPQGLFISKRRSDKGSVVPTEIATMPWDCVIWDESRNLHNPKSQTNEIAHLCFGQVPYRMILSGEYAPEGPLDIFEQLRWLHGHFMGHRNFWGWRGEFFRQIGYEWYPKPGTVTAIKEALSTKCFILRRKDCGLGEVKSFECRWCDLSPKARKLYDHAEKFYELPRDVEQYMNNENEDDAETKYAVVVDNWLAQMAGGYPKEFPLLHSNHKMKVLVELIKDVYPREQVVVAFRFNAELEAARQALERAGTLCRSLTGAVAPPARRDLQKAFQARQFHVILAQSRVLTFGIDLSAADTLIEYSLPPAYEIVSQLRDRIIHPQKKRPLAYVDLCCRDTVDEDLFNALGDKQIIARFFMQRLSEARQKRLQKKEVTVGV